MAACFADFRHRSIQYRLGVGLNFFGLGLFVTAFLLPELYTYTPGPGDVGLSVGQGDQMRVSVGLWEMCADGLRTCRGISLDHFPGKCISLANRRFPEITGKDNLTVFLLRESEVP